MSDEESSSTPSQNVLQVINGTHGLKFAISSPYPACFRLSKSCYTRDIDNYKPYQLDSLNNILNYVVNTGTLELKSNVILERKLYYFQHIEDN
jgi:hypothetical protein